MATIQKKKKYWTIERSIEEAKKYQYRSDFKKNSNRAYTVLCENGLMEVACGHMAKKDCIRKWTKEKCIEAAKQCQTKSEFGKRFNGAYTIAKRRGWFNELLQYFTPVGSKYKRCIYVCEFTDNHAYVGLTYDINKRKIAHLRDADSAIYQHIALTGLTPSFKQLTDYIDYIDAAYQEGVFLDLYKNNGWIMLNRTGTGGLGSKDEDIIRKWTKDKCLEVAKQCSSYTEFNEKYGGAIAYVLRHGFLDEIQEILPPKNPHRTKWSEESALEECRKYETINEFQKKSPGAYGFLLKHNLRDKMREGKRIIQRDEWTFDEAKAEALKYRTPKEFRKGARGCYGVAYKRGWLKEIIKDMETSRKIKYNEEMVKDILSNFSQMEQLKKSDDLTIRGVYWWLKKRKK